MVRIDAAGSHVRRVDRLDLQDVGEAAIVEQEVIVVGEDLVQEPDAFETVVVHRRLVVEVVEVWTGGEYESSFIVRLAVEFL